MKRILIALDYSPSAEKVAQAGYELAQALHAELRMVHVVTDPAYYAIGYSPIMGYQGAYTEGSVEIAKDIKEEASQFLAAASRHLGDKRIKIKVLDGDTEQAIMDYSKESKADMIVIGSHNHKGLERLFVTDVTAGILKHSEIPLLIVPTGHDKKAKQQSSTLST